MANETSEKATDASEIDSTPNDTHADDQREPNIPSAVSSGVVSHIPMFFDFCEEEPVLLEGVASDDSSPHE